ncbi:MAG: hypothetical protein IPP82_06080 [Xanthomonadales bacterium]|nr:hypothetical protein [Xanthomonadales bacterium]
MFRAPSSLTLLIPERTSSMTIGNMRLNIPLMSIGGWIQSPLPLRIQVPSGNTTMAVSSVVARNRFIESNSSLEFVLRPLASVDSVSATYRASIIF